MPSALTHKSEEPWYGFALRAQLTAPYLKGQGMEIGAGPNPQALPADASALYFDKREQGDLASHFETDIGYQVHSLTDVGLHFPNGADFLIAHNVLEHIPDEIGALVEWIGYVRKGGVLVLSMPDKRYTAGDKPRQKAPFRHLLDGFLFRRTSTSYEAKEGMLSFCLGWYRAGWIDWAKDVPPAELMDKWLGDIPRSDHDFHWHAVDRPTWDLVVSAAALFAGRQARLLASWDPETEGFGQTQGEVIYVLRLDDGDDGLPDVRGLLRNALADLDRAAARLRPLVSPEPRRGTLSWLRR